VVFHLTPICFNGREGRDFIRGKGMGNILIKYLFGSKEGMEGKRKNSN